MKKLELSNEQTLRLTELRDVLAKALPADMAETFEFPVVLNACGCGCTTSYYVTCATGCYTSCTGRCTGSCSATCGSHCVTLCIIYYQNN